MSLVEIEILVSGRVSWFIDMLDIYVIFSGFVVILLDVVVGCIYVYVSVILVGSDDFIYLKIW